MCDCVFVFVCVCAVTCVCVPVIPCAHVSLHMSVHVGFVHDSLQVFVLVRVCVDGIERGSWANPQRS